MVGVFHASCVEQEEEIWSFDYYMRLNFSIPEAWANLQPGKTEDLANVKDQND